MDKVKLELVVGKGGHEGLYLNDTRIAGRKPWGGGRVAKSWDVNVREVRDILNRFDNNNNSDEPEEEEAK